MSVIDCQSCGACCSTKLWEVVVWESDRVPRHLTRSVRRVVGFASFEADDTRRMHSVDGMCAALVGQIGSVCRCKIYDRRPANCRNFEPLGADCLKARQSAGLRSKGE